MQWSKDINNKWYLATNDIQYSDFKENLKPTSKLNIIKSDKDKAVVYVPTHNIHDVYEWFRIFKDNYLNTLQFDKYGFAIHGYFSKERGESIKGWFPNLIEVKATSTDTLKYFNDGIDYNRSSVDYIETFTGLTKLSIDDVEVFNEELVLLKNQYYETLIVYDVDNTLSTGNTYYVKINPGEEAYFKINNTCVIKTSDGQFIEDTIVSVSMPFYILLQLYVTVNTANIVFNTATKFADIAAGVWYFTDFTNNNGVYQYLNGNLTEISEMYDKYKTYGQIVYTYQGLTNENKEFYLRRNENLFLTKLGQYPTFGNVWPLNYSVGDAHLVKYEIDYNLDYADPQHPTVGGPFETDTNAYRLLFLDNTVADKVLSSDSDGIGTYQLLDNVTPSDIDMGIGTYLGFSVTTLNTITFTDGDANGYTNFIYADNREKYLFSSQTSIYEFRDIPLSVFKTYNLLLNANNNINIVQIS